MKRIAKLSLLALAATLLPTGKAAAQDAMGTVTYALPRTVISLQVEAVKEYFYAGPYAKYASKYLGIEAAEDFFRRIHMPTNITELIGRTPDEDELHKLVYECTYHGTRATIGPFQKLDENDMYQIFRMAAK